MITFHQSQYYAAHLTTQGLLVESTRKTGGVILRHDHAQFAEYVDALRTAIDDQEGDALCKALLN